MKILIIGRNEVLYNTALKLSEKHEIAGIITAKGAPEYLKSEKDFEDLAKQLDCPFLLTQKIDATAIDFIKEAKADIGVSVNWVSVIRENAIDLLPKGILNCHPGPLPKYRGNAATNWSMVLNEKQFGITIHQMIAGELDAGAIYVQRLFDIKEEYTIRDVNAVWEEQAAEMFEEAVNGIEDASIQGQEQDHAVAFRSYPRLPIDSKIDWNQSAEQIHNIIRASTQPYDGAYTYLKIDGEIKKLLIWSSRIVAKETKDVGTPGHIILNDKDTGESHVYTGQGIVALTSVQFDGEEVLEPGKVWKSIRMRFGIDIEEEIIQLRKKGS